MNINVSSSTNDFTTALFDLRPVWHVKGRSIIRARDTNVIRCITRRHLYRNHRNRIVQSPFHVFPHVDHPHLVSNFISLSLVSRSLDIYIRYHCDIRNSISFFEYFHRIEDNQLSYISFNKNPIKSWFLYGEKITKKYSEIDSTREREEGKKRCDRYTDSVVRIANGLCIVYIFGAWWAAALRPPLRRSSCGCIKAAGGCGSRGSAWNKVFVLRGEERGRGHWRG